MQNITQKFDQIASRYDAQRRALIPCFDAFYGAIENRVQYESDTTQILDLGAGTGLLSNFIHTKNKKGIFTLIDSSAMMLEIAKQRFANISKFEFITADYAHNSLKTNSFDYILSALSMHHLEGNDKWNLYKNIFAALKAGGYFINGDMFLVNSDPDLTHYRKQWVVQIEGSGLATDDKEAACDRMLMDKPTQILDDLKNLRIAGFCNVEIVFQHHNFAVVAAQKI